MKMLISREQLWRKIANDPDVDVDVGLPAVVFRDNDEPVERQEIVEVHGGSESPRAFLGAILRELRRREGLTIDALAEQTRLDVAEIYGLEQDPAFQPRPRTVHKLAERLSLPHAQVARLAGTVIVNEDAVRVEGYRFAAKSDDLSTMTPVERAQLSALVDAILAQNRGHS